MLDAEKLNEINASLDKDVAVANEVMMKSVNEYTADLDKIMENIKVEILAVEFPAIVAIEKYFLELSNCLYFISEKVERMGLYDSISKLNAQEVYNSNYLQHQAIGLAGDGKKPTVKELEAKAESDSIYETTLSDIHSRTYKLIKNKISAAETMVNTLSKLYSHRMQESQMMQERTQRQVLNESTPF